MYKYNLDSIKNGNYVSHAQDLLALYNKLYNSSTHKKINNTKTTSSSNGMKSIEIN